MEATRKWKAFFLSGPQRTPEKKRVFAHTFMSISVPYLCNNYVLSTMHVTVLGAANSAGTKAFILAKQTRQSRIAS